MEDGDGDADDESAAEPRVTRNNLDDLIYEFQTDQTHGPYGTELFIDGISFDAAKVRRLMAFLHTGVNSIGLPVHKLYMMSCRFNDESSSLFRDFLANNDAPETLKQVKLDLYHPRDEHALENILSAFRTNKTVEKLGLCSVDRFARGDAIVGDLLQQSHHLTEVELCCCEVDANFIRAMREGLLASRVQGLGFVSCDITEENLDTIRDIFGNNGQTNTALTAISITTNDNGGNIEHYHGLSWCNSLRRLIKSAGLTKLRLSEHYGASALFRAGPVAVMNQLQSLDVSDAEIEHLVLRQMSASISGVASLVHLNLSLNRIQGPVGCESLAHLLHRCGNLEVLDLSHNGLGASTTGALARALTNLHRLESLKMTRCDLTAVGAEAILTSCLRGFPRIKVMDLAENGLLPSSLIPLVAFLRETGGCLEELHLHLNRRLFGPTENGGDRQGPFFDALADHKRIQIFDIRDCGSNGQTEELLMSTLSKNTMLLRVHHSFDQSSQSLTIEYKRRNFLLPHIETMLDAKRAGSSNHSTVESPIKIISFPPSLWPMALDLCSPREALVGPTLVYCLAQKMKGVNVYSKTAAVYRSEKAQAIAACTRIQRWWRQHRPSVKAALFRQAMRDHVVSLSGENAALHQLVASLQRENASLREQKDFVNTPLASFGADLV